MMMMMMIIIRIPSCPYYFVLIFLFQLFGFLNYCPHSVQFCAVVKLGGSGSGPFMVSWGSGVAGWGSGPPQLPSGVHAKRNKKAVLSQR